MTDSTNLKWQPTRKAALQQLQEFVPRAGRDYTSHRNFDYGVDRRDNVSGLSPWLRYRCISEAEVVSAVLQQHTMAAADKFIQEVFWRSYWKGWLEMRPAVWSTYRQEVEHLHRQSEWQQALQQATAGQTGIDCFDHWCTELTTTGYLHNHARMWFASIWIFTLKLPWQLGADFFLQHLLDGDVASNTLSWRWVAGLHTKGKYYLARADNIAKYTDGRFNPSRQLVGDAIALTEQHNFECQALPSPDSVKPGGKTGLLLCDDDLHPEVSVNSDCVIAFSARRDVSPRGTSVLVNSFVDALVTDTLQRIANVSELPAICTTVSQVVDVAVAQQLDTLVTAYVPVGPNRDVLESLQISLQAQGIELITVRRQWDETVWPHAGKGFFALKKKIPSLVDQLLPDSQPQASLF
jgi:deoxyribodipyrimidine photo-lyase